VSEAGKAELLVLDSKYLQKAVHAKKFVPLIEVVDESV
jgi:hypothetical protein